MQSEIEMSGVVIAVNRSATHSLAKRNELVIRVRTGLGVDGDAHQGRTVKHRHHVLRNPWAPNLRQVHLIHSELHDELREAGFDLAPGRMGENVTTRGIDLLGLSEGTILRIGESAALQVTGLRNPCGQLDKIQPGLKAATLGRDATGAVLRKAGVMSVVLSDGDIRPGDRIVIEPPAGEHVPLSVV